MGEVRFAVWNVEWMNDLFTGDDPPVFKPDDKEVRGPRKKNTVLQRRNSLAAVVNDIEVDALVVVEGPNRASELQLFFDHSLVQGDWKCDVQPVKGGSQIVGLAVRTDTNRFADPPFTREDSAGAEGDTPLKLASDDFILDTNDDAIKELYRFERRPLYAELTMSDGKKFRVLGLHLKSKGIFQAYEWSKWWSMADANRKKILAQCRQLRQQFLNWYFNDDDAKKVPLIVCGDINDGPGQDTSERRLMESGIERLMGSIWKPHLALGNALFDALSSEDRQHEDFSSIHTTSFRDPIFDEYRRVWIDHILYSRNQTGQWVHDAKVHVAMSNGKKIWEDEFAYASDHFPVSVQIDL